MILHTHFLVTIMSQSEVTLLIHRRFSAVFLFTTTSVFTFFFFFKLADLSSFLADQVDELFLVRARVNLSTWHWILPLSTQGHDS